MVQRELDMIEEGGPESDVLSEKHLQWLAEAQKGCEKLIEGLNYKTSVDKYAVKHPEATGSQLAKRTGRI